MLGKGINKILFIGGYVMKDFIALLIIGGIVLSVSIVLLLLQYIMPGIILFGIATIIFASSVVVVKVHEEQPFNRRSRI